MPTLKEQSFGIIPLFKKPEGGFLFCVIERQGVDWSIPKGKPNLGESEEDTARRELQEETGITDVELMPDIAFHQEFDFEHEGIKYHKTVKYFLGFVSNINTEIPEEFKKEVSNIKWLPFEEAKAIMSYDNARVILEKAWEYLNKDLI